MTPLLVGVGHALVGIVLCAHKPRSKFIADALGAACLLAASILFLLAGSDLVTVTIGAVLFHVGVTAGWAAFWKWVMIAYLGYVVPSPSHTRPPQEHR